MATWTFKLSIHLSCRPFRTVYKKLPHHINTRTSHRTNCLSQIVRRTQADGTPNARSISDSEGQPTGSFVSSRPMTILLPLKELKPQLKFL